MSQEPRLHISLSPLEARFIFKAIAFCSEEKRLTEKEILFLQGIAAGIYGEYESVFGKPTQEELGIVKGKAQHQPHCRAPIGFVCSCVKTSVITKDL